MSQFEEHFNQIESVLDNTFGNDSNEPVDEENIDCNEELYCVACEKDFRSAKAMKNHENSKKHKENVALLKFMMEEEEAMENSNTAENGIEEEDDNTSKMSDSDENVSSEALLDELIKSSTKSKKKKKKNRVSVLEPEESIDLSTLDSEMNKIKIEDDLSNDSQKDILKENAEENLAAKSEPIRKKKEKIRKDANSSNAVSSVVEEKTEKPSTLCETCNTTFKSRNKLFEHLKESGHAVYKNENSINR
ncbi:DnaJ-like protein subfamily C member 21, partial [Stegodyphus mimosarum]